MDRKLKIIIVMVIVFLLILLFPIRNQLKDGGTVEYKAITYKISKVHRRAETEHEDGTIIEILGKEIFNNIIVTHIEKDQNYSYTELSNMALEYFFKNTPVESLPENVSKDEYHVGIGENVIPEYQNQDMVVIEIRHVNNDMNNTLDARYYINIHTAKGFDDSKNEINLNS